MKHAFLGVALAAVSAFVFLPPQPALANSTVNSTVNITASNWKFTPGTIIVHRNMPVTLRLTSAGGVHGIAMPDLGIGNVTILPGKFATVTFTPKKNGAYKVHCTVYCGAGHVNMILTIKVVN